MADRQQMLIFSANKRPDADVILPPSSHNARCRLEINTAVFSQRRHFPTIRVLSVCFRRLSAPRAYAGSTTPRQSFPLYTPMNVSSFVHSNTRHTRILMFTRPARPAEAPFSVATPAHAMRVRRSRHTSHENAEMPPSGDREITP